MYNVRLECFTAKTLKYDLSCALLTEYTAQK